jgi:rubrerythrin
MMIDDSTTPEEAIRLALQREKSAFEFYTKAAKIAKYPGTREMFEALAKEELRHTRLLEEELNKDYFKEM